jgi:hypothetical protein
MPNSATRAVLWSRITAAWECNAGQPPYREAILVAVGSKLLTHPTHQSPGLGALQAGAEAFFLPVSGPGSTTVVPKIADHRQIANLL